MAKLIKGERVGREGRLGLGCSAAIFDDSRQRMLLIRRTDNGLWAVPGGYMEPGESMTEACVREVLEETGLCVKVKRLISVYTDPHTLLVYPDGNRWQLVVLHFEAELAGGSLRTSAESSELRYFSQAEMTDLQMGAMDRLRVEDAFADQQATIIREAVAT